MSIETGWITAEELLDMTDDGRRHELVRGEIRKVPPVGSEHGAIAMNIGASPNNYVKANGLGRVYTAETGFKLASDPDTVRAPDAAFVSRERGERAGRVAGFWPGAPNLAVEVVSSNDTHAQVVEKVLAWLEAGGRMVLVADPEKATVTVYRSRENIRILTRGETVDGTDIVPGWKLPVTEVFA